MIAIAATPSGELIPVDGFDSFISANIQHKLFHVGKNSATLIIQLTISFRYVDGDVNPIMSMMLFLEGPDTGNGYALDGEIPMGIRIFNLNGDKIFHAKKSSFKDCSDSTGEKSCRTARKLWIGLVTPTEMKNILGLMIDRPTNFDELDQYNRENNHNKLGRGVVLVRSQQGWAHMHISSIFAYMRTCMFALFDHDTINQFIYYIYPLC